MRKVIIPVNSSVFSAWGMLMTDLRRDFLRTQVMSLSTDKALAIDKVFAGLEDEAAQSFAGEDAGAEHKLRLQRFADMRYLGQEHTVKVELLAGNFDADAVQAAIDSFQETHKREYTFKLENPVEIVNFHLVAYGEVPKHNMKKLAITGARVEGAVMGSRRVDFDEHGLHDATVYNRDLLEPEMLFTGPCIVEEAAATLVVPPGKKVQVDDYGNLHVYINA
jgi:N-methylhydantoinase A